MAHLKTYCECFWNKDGEGEDDEPTIERDFYWLLFWGNKYEIIDRGDGTVTTANYTVGVCQNIKTGQIECFPPESIRIIGNEVKE